MKSIEELAKILQKADKTKTPCSPIRGEFEDKDLEKAYRVQQFITDKKIARGRKIVGKKIGLTSKKVQAQLGVDQPDFGVLLDSMQIENGAMLPFAELLQPKAEAEVAFVLKEDLLETQNEIKTVKQAIDHAVIAIEIVGSRIENWDIQITDTIADNASASHFVLGKKRVQLEDLDLENCKMKMQIDGETASEGSGKACLGNPLNAVVWLADKMAEMGNPLKKDEVVLSGALGPMAVLHAGDRVDAEIEGLGEVSFEVTS